VAIIPVAEEVAVSTGLLTWLSRTVGLAAPLADLIFGRGHSEPTRNNAIGPLSTFLMAPAKIMHDMFAALGSALEITAATIAVNRSAAAARADVVAAYAKRLQGQALSYANGRANDVAALAKRLQTQALSYTDGRVGQTVELAKRLQTQALSYTDGRVGQTVELAKRLQAQALSYTDGRVGQTLTYVRGVSAGDRVYADTVSTAAAARATVKLGTDAASALAPSYQGIRSDLEAAAAVFGAGQPSITNLIKQLPAAMPAGLPGAEAATGKALRVLTKTMEDCVAPNCRDTSKFGKDLQSLFGLVEGAAFLAFLAFIIKDPDDAVRETFDTLDGLTHTIIDGARNLVGF